jgi:DNA polymerase-3 subunit delta'
MNADVAINHLNDAYAAGRLASAYILVGNPREAGGIVAESVLQLLFCSESGKPCTTCRACSQVSTRTHPDVLWVEPQKKSRVIAIEQIRGVQQRVNQTAFMGSWKACVLVGADRLGPEAANAFLKTLEEPAGDCLFLLLTDSPQFLLPTIMSRCQRIKLQDVEHFDEWDAGLIEILSADESVGANLGRATAAFARADRLAALFKAMKEFAQEEINESASSEALEEESDTLNARGSSRYREMRSRLMRTMLLWYRDLLCVTCGGYTTHMHFQDHADVINQRAKTLSYRQALQMVSDVEDMYRQMERNLPEGTVLGYGFGKLHR